MDSSNCYLRRWPDRRTTAPRDYHREYWETEGNATYQYLGSEM